MVDDEGGDGEQAKSQGLERERSPGFGELDEFQGRDGVVAQGLNPEAQRIDEEVRGGQAAQSESERTKVSCAVAGNCASVSFRKFNASLCGATPPCRNSSWTARSNSAQNASRGIQPCSPL